MAQTTPEQSEEARHARAAGLTYASDVEPGIRRFAKGTGFSYRGLDGKTLADKAMLMRIRSLAIPPAWTDVWICPTPTGHIQATGRDARARKQYRYHSAWQEYRDQNKYERMLDFARQLPRIRQRVAEDMSRRGATREKVLATAVSLLDRTLIRIGNEEYAKENGSYGLMTLTSRHVDIEGSELRFHFKGKSGKTWRLRVRDRRIARIARSIQELPGQQLFKYLDDGGVVRAIDSSDVNEYLREVAGPDVSAKDFRTWAGTVMAGMALSAVGAFETKAQAKTKVSRAISVVAERLGNTPAVCRKCYIHPEVIACYLEGALPVVAALDVSEFGTACLPKEEAAVLTLLERRLRKPRRARSKTASVRVAA